MPRILPVSSSFTNIELSVDSVPPWCSHTNPSNVDLHPTASAARITGIGPNSKRTTPAQTMRHGGCPRRRPGDTTAPLAPSCQPADNTTSKDRGSTPMPCNWLGTSHAKRVQKNSGPKDTIGQAHPRRTDRSLPSDPSHSKAGSYNPQPSSASSPRTVHCRPSGRRPSRTTHPACASRLRRFSSRGTIRPSPNRTRDTSRLRIPSTRGMSHSRWPCRTDPWSTHTPSQAGNRSSGRTRRSHIG